jgi:hypothetical protein
MNKGLGVGIQKTNAVRSEEKTCVKGSNGLLFYLSLAQGTHLWSQTFVNFPRFSEIFLIQEKQPSQPR